MPLFMLGSNQARDSFHGGMGSYTEYGSMLQFVLGYE
jgi:hypothetical protein